ncbi:MAG: hypothetical protein Q9165_005394 [Trypethelium subeluteriae]
MGKMGEDLEFPVAGPSGVRRRHSRNHEEDAKGASEQEEAASETYRSDSAGRRSHTDPLSSAAISGADRPAFSTSKPPTASAPRVRFSEEVERRPSWNSLRGDRDVNLDRGSKSPGIGTIKRPSTPELSLDTRRAASGPSILGRDTVLSPKSLRSPEAQKSPKSPISPGSRPRGYSLRSAIFRRNMSDVGEAREPIIEMDDVGSSSTTVGQQTDIVASPGKKSTDTVVSISPVILGTNTEATIDQPSLWDRSAKAAREKGMKGVKGVSALPNYQQWIEEKAAHAGITVKIKGYYRRTRKFILRIKDIPPSKDGRHIELDPSRKKALIDERTGHAYIGNTVRSSRYNAWNFIPRQLFAQFSKLANLYGSFIIALTIKLTDTVTF